MAVAGSSASRIPELVAQLEGSDDDAAQAAAAQLAALACEYSSSDVDERQALVDAGAVGGLAPLLDGPAQAASLKALGGLASAKSTIKSAVFEDGAVGPLCRVLSSAGTDSQRQAARILIQLVHEDGPDVWEEMCDAVEPEALLQVFSRTQGRARVATAQLLVLLLHRGGEAAQRALARAGVEAALLQYCKSKPRVPRPEIEAIKAALAPIAAPPADDDTQDDQAPDITPAESSDIPTLVDQLHGPEGPAVAAAAKLALLVNAKKSWASLPRPAVVRAGAVTPLVALLDGSDAAQYFSLKVLSNLTSYAKTRGAVLEGRAIHPLCDILLTGEPPAQHRAALTLTDLVRADGPGVWEDMRATEAPAALVDILCTPEEEKAQSAAAALLIALLRHGGKSAQAAVMRARAVPRLREYCDSRPRGEVRAVRVALAAFIAGGRPSPQRVRDPKKSVWRARRPR